MRRVMVGLLAGLLPLCWPVGGGSGALISVPLRPTPADLAPPEPETDPPPLTSFPRFIHPSKEDRAQWDMGTGRAPATAGPGRELLLTFDDGPDLEGTPRVLEALERHGHKAIFFVNGDALMGRRPDSLARREMVRRLAAHGQLVANHTLTHRNLCRGDVPLAEEIDTNSEIIAYATGLRPLLFRSPYGAHCPTLDDALQARDLIPVGWNVDPQEWRATGSDPDAVFAHVTRQLTRLRGRAILLLHDTHPAAVNALPRILAWVDAQRPPIRVVDYSVFVPARPLPPTGLEPLWRRLTDSLALLPLPFE